MLYIDEIDFERICYDNMYTEDYRIAIEQFKKKAIPCNPIVSARWLTWKEQFPDRKDPKGNKEDRLGVFCSACHKHADNKSSFCPHCGADMDYLWE